jgi:hypothetical protein
MFLELTKSIIELVTSEKRVLIKLQLIDTNNGGFIINIFDRQSLNCYWMLVTNSFMKSKGQLYKLTLSKSNIIQKFSILPSRNIVLLIDWKMYWLKIIRSFLFSLKLIIFFKSSIIIGLNILSLPI